MEIYKTALTIIQMPFLYLRNAWAISKVSTLMLLICLFLIIVSFVEHQWFSAGFWFLLAWSNGTSLKAEHLEKVNTELLKEVLILRAQAGLEAMIEQHEKNNQTE